jgi:glucose-6-phosphate 1-epimerase
MNARVLMVETQVFGVSTNHAPTSKLPQHGFARTSRWEYLGKTTSEATTMKDAEPGDTGVTIDFGLSPSNLDEEARRAWPYNFGLIYSVTLTRDGLETSMVVRNEGQESWDFQILMHTYLRVKVGKECRLTPDTYTA